MQNKFLNFISLATLRSKYPFNGIFRQNLQNDVEFYFKHSATFCQFCLNAAFRWGSSLSLFHPRTLKRALQPSTARDDFYDFQFVARVQLPSRKFRRRDRLAVVLHDDAARQQILRDQKFLNRARQLRLDRISVGGDQICVHENRLSKSLRVPIQIHSIISP